jgi:hypothetical protein
MRSIGLAATALLIGLMCVATPSPAQETAKTENPNIVAFKNDLQTLLASVQTYDEWAASDSEIQEKCRKLLSGSLATWDEIQEAIAEVAEQIARQKNGCTLLISDDPSKKEEKDKDKSSTSDTTAGIDGECISADEYLANFYTTVVAGLGPRGRLSPVTIPSYVPDTPNVGAIEQSECNSASPTNCVR